MASRLANYQSMRDFGKTAEPSGREPVPASDRLRFVIQKHDATRLHYDFRLENKGTMLSWAVTKGPSLDPADKRLAVEVEDHPLGYGDFEGTIPKGQYGGGTVMLWDRGYWAPEPGFEDVDKAIKAGELKFVLEGERLHGSWVLVRMKWAREGGKSKRSNWLLIKHKDDAAHPGDADALLTDNAVSVASGRTMEAIAAGEGPGPTPFIKSGKARAKAANVWRSNRDPEASAETATKAAEAKPTTKNLPPLGEVAAQRPKGAQGRKAKDSASAQPPSPAVAGTPLKRGRSIAAIPDFVPPQLCRIVDHPPSGADWAHEIKFDGYRMQLRVVGGKATLKTRKGLDWSARFPEIVAEGRALPDCMIDGEAVALDTEGAPDFAGLQAALSSGKTGGLIFYVFDLLFEGREDLQALPLRDRKARLQTLIEANHGGGRIRYVEHFETGGDAVLSSACRMHLEGIVSKRLDAPYVGGRSDSWTKAKCRGGQEVVIAGWTSEGGVGFRSLIAGVHRDGRFVHVGRIGTGFARGKVDLLLPRLKAVETDKSPFEGKGAPRGGPGIHWVRPDLVAEIESAGWTGDGNLRQASFKGLREDKPAAEVVQENAAPVETVETSSRPKPATVIDTNKSKGNVVMGVTLSNPDKVLWPAADGEPEHSKRDLALYYEAVGEAMLPHIKGRPCSIIRCPDGVGGQGFFQRHVGKGASALVTSTTVSGDRQPYMQLDRVEALAAMAQTGALELHPWNCAPFKPEVPGRLIFDLDPSPGVDFKAVIDAAKEVKARLEAVGLVAFVKTTGGKGLHVVTPLTVDPKLSWPQAKAFARTLCEQMAADSPDRYLVNMSKAKRVGRIFLDYLRNDRMSTAVAPYSPRARAGAPVSWPITWGQVKAGLDPKAFTIRTAPTLLKKNKAWDGYDEAARPLLPAIKTLGGESAA